MTDADACKRAALPMNLLAFGKFEIAKDVQMRVLYPRLHPDDGDFSVNSFQ